MTDKKIPNEHNESALGADRDKESWDVATAAEANVTYRRHS